MDPCIAERQQHYELWFPHISVDFDVLRFRNIKTAWGFQGLGSGYLNQPLLQMREVVRLIKLRA